MRLKIFVLLSFCALVASLTTLAQQRGANAPAAEQRPKAAVLIFRESFRTDARPRQLHRAEGSGHRQSQRRHDPPRPGANAKPDHESGLLMNQGDDEAKPGTNMSFIWSGVTEGNWAILLKDKNSLLDLTGAAKIRWRQRPRSFHVLRPLVKLTDGTIYIGDYGEPGSTYWRETEFYPSDIPRWRQMNPETADMMRNANWKNSIDLSKVDEIGFTDLSRGAGHGAEGNSAVDWVEVYGQPIKR
jgi:hypothetical protein